MSLVSIIMDDSKMALINIQIPTKIKITISQEFSSHYLPSGCELGLSLTDNFVLEESSLRQVYFCT